LNNARGRLYGIHLELSGKALEVMRAKNHDYAGENSDNPFRNFDGTPIITQGVVSPELGMLVRLGDKLSRIGMFLTSNNPAVNDENFEDTILDGINYLILIAAIRRERKPS